MARSDSRGFTLLEVVVVLVLLSVALALSVPSLVPPRAGSDDPRQRLIDTARRTAVRRAESLALAIEPDGRWTIASSDRSDPRVVRTGRLDDPSGGALGVIVTPLGACWIEGDFARAGAPALDPVRCRLAGPS
jgi:prepilin-type N-terminal cleavage/methylation domain-containing protein